MVLVKHEYGYSIIPDKVEVDPALQRPHSALNEQRVPDFEPPLTQHADLVLKEHFAKSSQHVVPSFYDVEDVPISNKERPEAEDVTDTQAIRRAIHTISNYYNTLGVYRDDFDKGLNDKLARNAYYVLCEKAIMDYMGSATYKVVDRDGNLAEPAMDFLERPNPQEDFGTLIKMALRDTVRYDAGVWVKSFNVGGYLTEMKCYLGTEFWKEQDRVAMIINMPFSSAVNFDRKSSTYATHWEPAYTGWWSHGYTERYWQRSRTGVYIPFAPEEITYFMMYPRSDGIYGTDFLKYLRYQLQYLIDSTKAAGKTFENGLVPSLVWMHENVRNIQQLEQRIREVKASNQGPNRFGSVLHTVNGEKVESLAQTLLNMQWLEGQKFIAQLIWAMWGFSPQEFVGEGENRATAYVKRNVTKSRLLYPIMDHIEKKVNREVLPYLKGYKKGWKFMFLRDVDLDDDQKLSQTTSTRAGTVAQYIGLGYTASQAMKLAGLGDELKLMDTQSLDDQVMQFQASQQPAGGGEGENMTEDGRYDGEGAGTEGYFSVNMSDYGQGGEQTETRTGDEDEKQYRKGDLMYVKDHVGVIRKAEIISEPTDKIRKAKVYINSPSEAPKGRTVKRGGRGGYYYITSERQQAHPKSNVRSGPKRSQASKKKRGWNVRVKGNEEKEWQEPETPDVTGSDRYMIVEGEGVSVYLMETNGEMKMEAMSNDDTKAFLDLIRNCFKSNDEDTFDCVRRLAKENGLVVTVG
jgi:hypothetical protein